MADIERRTGSGGAVAVRAATTKGEAPRIGGYAATFNREASIAGMFREVIAPGAFTAALRRSDPVALFNHDTNLLLGRKSSWTLDVREDDRGLRYDVDLPNTTLGRDVHELVKRGDVAGSSFAFTVKEEAWAFPKVGLPLRTILEVDKLYDVSPVVHPAYEGTSVQAREARGRREHAADVGLGGDAAPLHRAMRARVSSTTCARCAATLAADGKVIIQGSSASVLCPTCASAHVLRARTGDATAERRRRLAQAERDFNRR